MKNAVEKPVTQIDQGPEAPAQKHEQQMELFTGAIEQAGFNFELNESGRMGRMDSAHGVGFGVITDDEGVESNIAVKTFDGTGRKVSTRARNESRNYKKVQQRGFNSLNVYETLPFVELPEDPQGQRVTFLLTNEKYRLSPMNGQDWQVLPGEPTYETQITLLEQIAKFTGEMHGKGVIHNDWQLKNIVRDANGEFVLVDLEKALIQGAEKLSETTDPRQPARDIRVLVTSLLRHGFMHGASSDTVFEIIQTKLINPYFQSLGMQMFPGESDAHKPESSEFMNSLLSEINTDITKLKGQHEADPNRLRLKNLGHVALRQVAAPPDENLIEV